MSIHLLVWREDAAVVHRQKNKQLKMYLLPNKKPGGAEKIRCKVLF